jgi:hypothetical protein
MSRINTYFFLFLIALSLHSCFSSKNANRNRMLVSLNQTKWLVKNAIDSGKVDTIKFSFGYYNTGGELDLISYNSKTTKELCEFKIVKDTIIFESYSTAPPSIEIDFAHCKTKSVLIYANNKIRYTSLVSYCGENEKENISQPSTIEITKL